MHYARPLERIRLRLNFHLRIQILLNLHLLLFFSFLANAAFTASQRGYPLTESEEHTGALEFNSFHLSRICNVSETFQRCFKCSQVGFAFSGLNFLNLKSSLFHTPIFNEEILPIKTTIN